MLRNFLPLGYHRELRLVDQEGQSVRPGAAGYSRDRLVDSNPQRAGDHEWCKDGCQVLIAIERSSEL